MNIESKTTIMNNISSHLYKFSFLFLILFVFSSCKNEALIKPGDSLQTAYEKAIQLYESERYSDAADAFETVIEIGRGTDYGQQAQYYLAQSYFNNERYLLAASEYERYISLYPQGQNRQDVQFKEAYCYYQLSPRYKLDQSYTRQAIEKFRLFNSRYPESAQTQEASQYISEMRSKLAKKLYYSADLYMRTDQYEAAIIYYDLTIDNYPETNWAQRALVDEIQAYNTYASRSVQSKQQQRYQKAVDTYEKFVQLFPNGEYRQQAEAYVDEARSALAALDDSSQAEQSTASASSNSSE
ncbi:MAG: outer membrane protein assembly factor BamD [Fodinibius sp.]|nr:outer membrane protein assembly factor BamD [Fodinibius sp.]